ncbi:hypothetical protein F4824DRAFT_496808 [Ustulina deusta]|nr:hypothetical protein F4824DRAFT_496808 [Ustulina deusta]
MLQHRRIFTIVLVALSLVYVYQLCSTSRNHESPPWVRQGRDMPNSTLSFEKIFVINLPSRRDRRDAMVIAGAVSNFNFTFLEGLTGDRVSSAPKGADQDRVGIKPSHSASAGARGSWGSHVSALQTIVDHGLGSALVLEDDVDWDARLKTQMETFAMASRMWLDVQQQQQQQKREEIARLRNLETTKPPRGGSGLLSRVLSMFSGNREQEPEADSRASGGRARKEEFDRDTIPLPPNSSPSSHRGHKARIESPYGDGWDVLWLGHCGAELPTARRESPSSAGDPFSPSSSSSSSSLKISIPGDMTVPAPKHLQPHPFALRDALADAYPAHTRVVHATCGNVCSLAYAVSQGGARKLLRRVKQEGHRYAGEAGGASVSDIRGQGGGLARGKKGTPYVRLSVQENLDRLVAGFPVDWLVDQLPDEGDTLW